MSDQVRSQRYWSYSGKLLYISNINSLQILWGRLDNIGQNSLCHAMHQCWRYVCIVNYTSVLTIS